MQSNNDLAPLSDDDINAISNLALDDRGLAQRPVMPTRRFNDVQAAPAPAPAPAPQVVQVPPPVQAAQPTSEAPAPIPRQRRFNKVVAARFAVGAAAVVLVSAIIGTGSYAIEVHNKNLEITKQMAQASIDPARIAERQTVTMIAKAGQLMTLPTDEKPVVSTIEDVAKARAQSNFFANAEQGDVVMLYAKNGQAVLYRPLTNTIVLAGQLVYGPPAAAPASAVSSTSSAPKPTR